MNIFRTRFPPELGILSNLKTLYLDNNTPELGNLMVSPILICRQSLSYNKGSSPIFLSN